MNMSGDIRVRTDKRYRTLYNDLKNFAVGDMHEFFFLCTCLGYKAKRKISLGRDGEERFWSSTFTPEEYACFYAIILEEYGMDYSTIQDDRKVISRMQEYANGGTQIIFEDFLSDYLVKNSELHLDTSFAKELPKVILNFIWEEISSSA